MTHLHDPCTGCGVIDLDGDVIHEWIGVTDRRIWSPTGLGPGM
jgi:hypothetical protein